MLGVGRGKPARSAACIRKASADPVSSKARSRKAPGFSYSRELWATAAPVLPARLRRIQTRRLSSAVDGYATRWGDAGRVIKRGINQHLAKRSKHFPHLGLFVWKDVDGVHCVNGHSAIDLENQQLSIGGLAAIDADIFQFQPLGDGE